MRLCIEKPFGISHGHTRRDMNPCLDAETFMYKYVHLPSGLLLPIVEVFKDITLMYITFDHRVHGHQRKNSVFRLKQWKVFGSNDEYISQRNIVN